jgi:hypothetical protein
MGAQSLVGADEMRNLQSYLGPLDRLVGTGVHLVPLDYALIAAPFGPARNTPGWGHADTPASAIPASELAAAPPAQLRKRSLPG